MTIAGERFKFMRFAHFNLYPWLSRPQLLGWWKIYFWVILKTKKSKSADLVTFTEQILNGKLHFLCCETSEIFFSEKQTQYKKRNICFLLFFAAAYVARRPAIAVTCTKDLTGNNIDLAAIVNLTLRLPPLEKSVLSIMLLILLLKLNIKW